MGTPIIDLCRSRQSGRRHLNLALLLSLRTTAFKTQLLSSTTAVFELDGILTKSNVIVVNDDIWFNLLRVFLSPLRVILSPLRVRTPSRNRETELLSFLEYPNSHGHPNRLRQIHILPAILKNTTSLVYSSTN